MIIHITFAVHRNSRHTSIDAESILCVAQSWLSIFRTHVGTFELAVLSGELMKRVETVFTIALVFESVWVRLVNGYTFGPMETNVLSPRTDIQLMLALDAKVTIGTNAMLKVNIGLVVILHIGTKLREERSVFLPNSACTAIFALQVALGDIILRYATWMFTGLAVKVALAFAPFVRIGFALPYFQS